MELFHPPLPADLVTFNVRGRIFQTTLTTLRRFPESVLYKMVQYEQERNRATPAEPPSQKAFFIDRDPDLFAAILRYHDTEQYVGEPLNSTVSRMAKLLLLEAQYLNLPSLEQEILLEKGSVEKYEFCSISSNNPSNCSIPIDLEATRVYAKQTLDALFTSQGLRSLLSRLSEELSDRNNAQPDDGYRWTLWAVTLFGAHSVPTVYHINVILKGTKEY